MNYINTFLTGSDEYNLLEMLALRLTQKSKNGWHYYVDNTWFDYGANMRWTTVICDDRDALGLGGYQALNPREQETLLLNGVAIIDELVDEIFADKYCPDK